MDPTTAVKHMEPMLMSTCNTALRYQQVVLEHLRYESMMVTDDRQETGSSELRYASYLLHDCTGTCIL